MGFPPTESMKPNKMNNLYKYKVSVIIPTYNRADLLPMTVESVFAQTYKNYEIIIVDDGSTDNTKEIVEPYLSKSNIRYFYQENRKQASARNNGIRNSEGEYIAFLDSDDLWHPEKLDLQVKVLEEHPEVGLVYSNQSLLQEDSSKDEVRYPPGVLKSGNIFKDLLIRKFYCSTSGLLVRKSVLDDVGFFDESLRNALEDWELSLRISKKYKAFCVDKPLFKRRLHVEVLDNYFEVRINNHQNILKKYLDDSALSKSFINYVWGKANYSWSRKYFERHYYNKAFKFFWRSLLKGNLVASFPMLLTLLGPVGKGIFEFLLKLYRK